jgi:hypothetical protein
VQPQTQSSKEKEVEVLDFYNPCCKHFEKIDRLKVKSAECLTLALAKEVSINEGLVDASKPNRKRRKNKKKNKGFAYEVGEFGPRKGGMLDPTSRGYTGANNPSHIFLFITMVRFMSIYLVLMRIMLIGLFGFPCPLL